MKQDESHPECYRLAYLQSRLVTEALKVSKLPGKGKEFEPVKEWINKELLEEVLSDKSTP